MFLAEKGSKKVLLDIVPYDQVQWTGAKYRSHQIYQIFAGNGFQMTYIPEPPHPGKIRLLQWAIRALFRFGIYRPLSVMGMRMCGHTYYKFSGLIKQYPEIQTYIIEGTGFGILQATAVIKSLKRKIILIPMNMESLVPHPGSWTHSLPAEERLTAEVKYYRMADAVFTISMEELWLMSVMGCTAFFFPYEPPVMLHERIANRRKLRLTSQKEGGFYFANFGNYVNYLGFQKFIEEEGYKGKAIRIAGMQIDKIVPLIQDKPEFTVLGELSDEALESELIRCEFVILNHFATAGMLTRVPELLFSGIPVRGNDAALKAYRLIPQECADVIQHLQQITVEGAAKLLELV